MSLSSIIAAISCVIGSLIIHDYILFGMSAFVSIILILDTVLILLEFLKVKNQNQMDVKWVFLALLVLLIKYDKQFMFNHENNMF